jgi:hypothetical protein
MMTPPSTRAEKAAAKLSCTTVEVILGVVIANVRTGNYIRMDIKPYRAGTMRTR